MTAAEGDGAQSAEGGGTWSEVQGNQVQVSKVLSHRRHTRTQNGQVVTAGVKCRLPGTR